MIFRCDCCLSEEIISSDLEIPVQLMNTHEQLCRSCIDVLVEEQLPLLSYIPSLVLVSVPVLSVSEYAA